jgi:hypothetical protein
MKNQRKEFIDKYHKHIAMNAYNVVENIGEDYPHLITGGVVVGRRV